MDRIEFTALLVCHCLDVCATRCRPMPERHVFAMETVQDALRRGDTGSDDWFMLAELLICDQNFEEAVKASGRSVTSAQFEGSPLVHRRYAVCAVLPSRDSDGSLDVTTIMQLGSACKSSSASRELEWQHRRVESSHDRWNTVSKQPYGLRTRGLNGTVCVDSRTTVQK
jgi:hypothetical protein